MFDKLFVRLVGKAAAMLVAGAAFAWGTAAYAQQMPLGYHIVKRIPMSDGWWDYASFDPVHRRLFVSRGNGVFQMDVDTGRIDQRVIPGSEGRGILVLPGGNRALAVMAGYSIAILFTPGRGEVKKVFELNQQGDAALWDPATQRIWVMGLHGEATVIDPVGMREVGRVNLGDDILEFGVADGKGRIFVNTVRTAEITVVDSVARRVVAHYRLSQCDTPTGLAYVPSNRLLISACSNGVAKVIRADDGAEAASLPIGGDPDAVIYDAKRRLAFIPSAEDGTLSVLAVSTDGNVRVLERDKTQIGTRTGALDPETGVLYLPTAKFGPKNKLGWSEALPGTVQLLVMAPAAAH